MSESQRSEQIRRQVRARYADAARRAGSSCCGGGSSCCGPQSSCCGDDELPEIVKGTRLGYDAEELGAVAEAAMMTLGCGNPTAIAALKPGEVVLDLGSGGGLDCFLAARQVGEAGRVIGVDMTPDMLAKARDNAAKLGYPQVEFRLGEIEHLPVADASVDVILSNCVINLSPDKRAVFAESFRVLKPGGRLAVSDTVATAPVPEEARQDMALWSACASGSATVEELRHILAEVGFERIRIQPKEESREMISEWVPGSNIEDYVLSATIEAVKP